MCHWWLFDKKKGSHEFASTNTYEIAPFLVTSHIHLQASEQDKCNEYGRHFLGSSSLNGHRVTYHGKVRFPCEHCSKGYANHRVFEHQTLHTGIKPWLCWAYGYRISYSESYRIHF